MLLPALLLVLVLAGLRGAATVPGWAGRYRGDDVAVGVALEAVLAVLLLVLAVRGRRAPREAFLAARLRTMLVYVLTAAVVAIPLVLLLGHVRPGHPPAVHSPPHGKLLPRIKPPPHVKPPAGLEIPLADALYGLLVALLLAAVVYCWVLVSRRRRGGPGAGPRPEPAGEPGELRAAVESGRAAMRRFDDTRAAIIACYAAMEQSLARAGAARGVADTPDELLARAVAAGLARDAAAGRLTALFYEARFSTHPLARGLREEAEQALTEIAASLRRRAHSPERTAVQGGRP